MRTTFFVQNLKCGGCGTSITSALHKIPGVEDVSISTEDSSVSFGYAEKSDVNIVKEALWKLGYPVDGDKNSFSRKATSYVSCALGRMS